MSKNKLPQVYKPATDNMEDVTQEWCDAATKSMNKLAMQRDILRKIISLNIHDSKLTEINDFIARLGL
jgi:hypothetical protein